MFKYFKKPNVPAYDKKKNWGRIRQEFDCISSCNSQEDPVNFIIVENYWKF